MTNNMGLTGVYRKALGLTALLLLSPSAYALQPGVEVKVGTLGIGADLVLGVNDYFSGRVGHSEYTVDDDFDDSDGVNYNAELTLGGTYALIDYHPFASGFRISAGLMSSDIGVKGEANLPSGPGSQVNIGGTLYDVCGGGGTDVICGMSSSVGFAGAKPYVGLGWGASYDSNISFSMDIGVMVQGDADVDIDLDLGTGGAAVTAAAIAEEERLLEEEINGDLQDNVYPVLSIGLAIAF